MKSALKLPLNPMKSYVLSHVITMCSQFCRKRSIFPPLPLWFPVRISDFAPLVALGVPITAQVLCQSRCDLVERAGSAARIVVSWDFMGISWGFDLISWNFMWFVGHSCWKWGIEVPTGYWRKGKYGNMMIHYVSFLDTWFSDKAIDMENIFELRRPS